MDVLVSTSLQFVYNCHVVIVSQRLSTCYFLLEFAFGYLKGFFFLFWDCSCLCLLIAIVVIPLRHRWIECGEPAYPTILPLQMEIGSCWYLYSNGSKWAYDLNDHMIMNLDELQSPPALLTGILIDVCG